MIDPITCNTPLYTENEGYTTPAYKLQEQMDFIIRDVFFQWMRKGFKIRDINNVIRGSIDKVQMEMFTYKEKS